MATTTRTGTIKKLAADATGGVVTITVTTVNPSPPPPTVETDYDYEVPSGPMWTLLCGGKPGTDQATIESENSNPTVATRASRP